MVIAKVDWLMCAQAEVIRRSLENQKNKSNALFLKRDSTDQTGSFDLFLRLLRLSSGPRTATWYDFQVKISLH